MCIRDRSISAHLVSRWEYFTGRVVSHRFLAADPKAGFEHGFFYGSLLDSDGAGDSVLAADAVAAGP